MYPPRRRTRRRSGDRKEMFYAYALKSTKNDRVVYRFNRKPKAQVSEHNRGLGGKYTKDNRRFELEYYEAYTSYDLAKKAERFYKTGHGREIMKEKLEI